MSKRKLVLRIIPQKDRPAVVSLSQTKRGRKANLPHLEMRRRFEKRKADREAQA